MIDNRVRIGLMCFTRIQAAAMVFVALGVQILLIDPVLFYVSDYPLPGMDSA